MNIRDLPQPHSNMKIPSPGRFHQACLKAKLLAIAGLMMAANTAIAAPATSVVNTTGLAVTDNSVKVGILHSSTGTMAISETGSIQAEKLAIEQINAAGGYWGEKLNMYRKTGPATGRPLQKKRVSYWSVIRSPLSSAAGLRLPAKPCCRYLSNITACSITQPLRRA